MIVKFLVPLPGEIEAAQLIVIREAIARVSGQLLKKDISPHDIVIKIHDKD